MAAIARRSAQTPVSIAVTLATADDLNGVQDNTKSFDITGATRAILIQEIGTTGTHGVDVVAYSKDGGKQWTAAQDVLNVTANDATGTICVDGALNEAGTDTNGVQVFKCGPFEGPTAIRVFRYVTDMANSIAWQTGAPSVKMFTIGQRVTAPVVV
jgi:hypothetical protein